MNTFFIVGLPGTGSTWLMNMLNSVPGIVCMGEGRFFSSGLRDAPSLYESIISGLKPWLDYVAARKSNWLDDVADIVTIERHNYVRPDSKEKILTNMTRGMIHQAILQIFERRSEQNTLAIGDKTPTTDPSTLQRIKNTIPESRIIFIHRGLFDFMASNIFHFYNSVKSRKADAHSGLFDEDDFLSIHDYVSGRSAEIVPDATFLRLARVWRRMDRLYQISAAQDTACCLRYEDLRRDTTSQFERVVTYLVGDESQVELEDAVQAWRFDGPNMNTTTRREQVNSRVVGYGEQLFSQRLLNLLDQDEYPRAS